MDRPRKEDFHYIQRDLEAIKHTLDRILKPYKADVKQLREENTSLRVNIARKEEDVLSLMRIIAEREPALVDDALATMLDPKRRGWKKFRSAWRYRLGLED